MMWLRDPCAVYLCTFCTQVGNKMLILVKGKHDSTSLLVEVLLNVHF